MDMEKVIKGLTKLSNLGIPDCAERSCPFWKVCVDGEGCYFDLFPFALALMKEQEAVEPRVSTAEQRCGHCNKVIEMDGWQSCPWCGKRIDWKGWWKKNGTRNQDS